MSNSSDSLRSNNSNNNNNKGCVLRIYDNSAVFENIASGDCLFANQLGYGVKDVQNCHRSKLPDNGSPAQIIPIEAIFGFYDLLSGTYVAVAVETENVSLKIKKVRKMLVTPLFRSGKTLSESKQADENRFLQLLHLGFSSHNFYFSQDWDLTLTQQRTAKLTKQQLAEPIWSRAEPRYFWNREVITDLIACEANDWIVPFMSAYIEYLPKCSIDGHKFALLFISRRSRFRQGCRFTKRGLDDHGYPANYVETEQILYDNSGRITSFVQIRGSIPLKWSSPVLMKYDPNVYIDDDRTKSVHRAELHVQDVINTYAHTAEKFGLILINLVDNKKDQGKLGTAFKEVIDAVQSKFKQPLTYVWFDFHHECKQKGKWNNLAKLIALVDDKFSAHGFFCREANGTVSSWQHGVVRTNCMDNLDRTNVVQSLLARRSLIAQLGVPTPPNMSVLDSPWAGFEVLYKQLWVNNADAMSMAYAGTGALKVDFTKTGKRTIKGMLNDAVNSIMRYYYNNFTDGVKQDSIDLMLGYYRPDISSSSPFVSRAGHEFLVETIIKIFVLGMTFHAFLRYFVQLLKDDASDDALFAWMPIVVTLVCMGYMLFVVVIRGSGVGERLVVHPQLVPEQVHTLFTHSHH